MRFILYSFLFFIFAFKYCNSQFHGQAGSMRRGSMRRGSLNGPNRGWGFNSFIRGHNMKLQAQSMQRRGSLLNQQTAQFKRMGRRKKRDVYETFEKVPGRD
ncbi:Hypothetical protein SRAE_X000037600 [Strongyloides ratti]|uniref:Uncharacterized protein n=1 Tax=Strongyloides ratti TaxID=34506 RepID=A0A090LTS7_STRRB|nr:Hypothetical protein SRAE_X000037600 [Strongyloides ratti]CEF71049.1 Hypothetical protein SRAE_X000037600 [Strongyloides ratti]